MGDSTSPGTGKAKQAYEVCKGSYKRAREVYKDERGTGKALAVSMVDISSQLGLGLHQDKEKKDGRGRMTFVESSLARI